MELHCPAICFTNDFKALIAKRSPERKLLPNIWEFGAAKPNGDESMIETLKREYKEDFNIDIIPICIHSQETPIPINSYEVEKDSVLCKGIVFAAALIDPDDIQLSYKHSEYQFISVNEAYDIDEDEAVPDLSFNIIRAYDICHREMMKIFKEHGIAPRVIKKEK